MNDAAETMPPEPSPYEASRAHLETMMHELVPLVLGAVFPKPRPRIKFPIQARRNLYKREDAWMQFMAAALTGLGNRENPIDRAEEAIAIADRCLESYEARFVDPVLDDDEGDEGDE